MIETLAEADLAGWASHFTLVILRMVGLFVFVPFYSSLTVPMRLRIGIAVVLALVLMPTVPRLDPAPIGALGWAVSGVRELAAGFAFGIAARVVFAAVDLAASLVAGQTGFSLASMINPASGDTVVAPALFMNIGATTLMLAANLHHLFVRALFESYRLLPQANTLPSVAGLDEVGSLLGVRMFTVAVELATPALIITVTMDMVMVLVGKAMPQIPILVVAYPFKLAAGMVSLIVLLTGLGAAIDWMGRTMVSDGARILALFGA